MSDDIVAQLGARAAVWDNLNGMLDREAIDEIKRLRAALEHIIREGQGVNKGPACAELARRALGEKG